jgi:hypothetical protein
MQPAMLLFFLGLTGCSASFEIARPRPPIVAPAAGAGTTVIEPNGEVIEEASPIQNTLTSLSQAQELRTLIRQLAR